MQPGNDSVIIYKLYRSFPIVTYNFTDILFTRLKIEKTHSHKDRFNHTHILHNNFVNKEPCICNSYLLLLTKYL